MTFNNSFKGYIIACLLFSIHLLQAQVNIKNESITKSIHPHFSGFNNNMATSWFPWSNGNPQGLNRQKALSKIRTGNWRYPGGTVSTYWDHQNDRLFGRVAEIETVENEPRNFVDYNYTISWLAPFGSGINALSDLKTATTIVSQNTANPMSVVWVLNMTTPGFDYYEKLWNRTVDQNPSSSDYNEMMNDRYNRALNMLNRAKSQGFQIDYIELGNEFFFNQLPSGTASNGASILEPYIAGDQQQSIIGAFPVNGKYYATVANDWAKKLKQEFPGVSICVVGSDDNDGPVTTRRNVWNDEVLPLMDRTYIDAVSFHIYESVDDTSGNLTTNESNLGKAFIEFNESWENVQERSNMPEDLDWWITEYNTNFRKLEEGTWGGGLHSVYATLRWLERDPLKLIQFHQFDEASIRVGENITGTGRALSLLGLATSGSTKATKLELNNVDALAGSNNEINSIIAWKFTSNLQNKDYYLLLNLGDANVDFQLPSNTGEGQIYYTSASLSNNVSDPGEVAESIPQNKKIGLQKYSIYVVEAESENTEPVAITSFTIMPKDVTLEVGDTFKPEVDIKPTNATNKNIQWDSDNPSIVSVNNIGDLTAISEGRTVITATTEEGNFSEKIQVEVVELDPDNEKYRYLRLIGKSTNELASTIAEIDWLENDTEFPREAITNITQNLVQSDVNEDSAWRAYDDENNGWLIGLNFPATIDIDLGEENRIKPTAIRIRANARNRGFGSFDCYGSNNGVNWTLLHSESGLTKDDYPDKIGTFPFDENPSDDNDENPLNETYKFLKLEGLSYIQLPTTIVEINWLSNQKQLPEVKLTNNDLVSSNIDSPNVFRAFDGKQDGFFLGQQFPAEIVLHNPESLQVDGISIKVNAQNRGLSRFKCYGSNDNNSWELLYEIDNLKKSDYPDKTGVFNFSQVNRDNSTKESIKLSKVELVTNPVNGFITFTMPLDIIDDSINVSVLTLDGRKIQSSIIAKTKIAESNTFSIPINKTLIDGIYIVRIQSGKKVFIKKIVKVR